jgi:hypothetical protein
MRILGGLLFAMAVVSTSARAAEPPKIALLPISAKHVPAETAQILDELLTNTVDRLGMFQVTSSADVNAMLGLERMKDALGCSDVSCGVEIGGALGVSFLMTGTVGELGGELVISLTVIDNARSAVSGRGATRVAAREALYARAIERAVLDLFRLNVGESDWQEFLRYREAAMKSAFSPLNVDAWKRQAAARNADWLAYFAHRNQMLESGQPTLDFEVWHADVKLGRIRLTSTPPGATVRVSGREVGKTPMVAKAQSAGVQTVEIELGGYFVEERQLEVRDFTEARLDVTLIERAEVTSRAEARDRQQLLGAVSAAGAAAALLGAVALFATMPTRDELDGRYDDSLAASDRDGAVRTRDALEADVEKRNLMAGSGLVLLGVGVVAGAFGLWELATLPAPFHAELLVGDGAASLSLGGDL